VELTTALDADAVVDVNLVIEEAVAELITEFVDDVGGATVEPEETGAVDVGDGGLVAPGSDDEQPQATIASDIAAAVRRRVLVDSAITRTSERGR
jgi:hypothetical protein